jgi:hypothetical protein
MWIRALSWSGVNLLMGEAERAVYKNNILSWKPPSGSLVARIKFTGETPYNPVKSSRLPEVITSNSTDCMEGVALDCNSLFSKRPSTATQTQF